MGTRIFIFLFLEMGRIEIKEPLRLFILFERFTRRSESVRDTRHDTPHQVVVVEPSSCQIQTGLNKGTKRSGCRCSSFRRQ